MCRVLRVEIVILAAPTAIVPVRRRDLQNLDPGRLNEAQQAGPIAAGALDADALDLTEGSHPGEHLPIALAGRGEALASQNTVAFIDDRRDMQILVGVHTADNASLPARVLDVHSKPPGSTVLRRLRQDRVRGQDSHVTRGQALLGSQASARQSLTARRSRAADGSGERHGWSIGVRVRPHRDALRRQPTKRSIGVGVRPPGNWR